MIAGLAAALRRGAAAAVLAGLLAGCGPNGRYGGYPADPVLPAPDLPLRLAGGRTMSFAQSEGRATLVTFGYTTCPDVCPTTLSDWARVRRALGRDAARVRFVFVSADWKHDTPEAALAFAQGFDPSFVGATADSATLRSLLPAFKAEAAYGVDAHGHEGFQHTDYSYLLDPRGRLIVSYSFQTAPRTLARDIRRTLHAKG